MGCVNSITHKYFPEQSKDVGKTTDICFHYDTSNTVKGEVIRDDKELPYITMFKITSEGPLKDKTILSTECQYTPPK